MLPLEKTLALVIQLPPSLKVTEGIENLRQCVVPELDDRSMPSTLLLFIIIESCGLKGTLYYND